MLTESEERHRVGRPLFWHYPHYSTQEGSPASAVRDGKYKLIEFLEDDHCELYNLSTDIGERHDLSKELPTQLNVLRTLLLDWRSRLDAGMPTPNPGHNPVD